MGAPAGPHHQQGPGWVGYALYVRSSPAVALIGAALALAVVGAFMIRQPGLQPDFGGGGSGFQKAYVSNTYVCGDVLHLSESEDEIEIVRMEPVGIPAAVAETRVLATTSKSSIFGMGAVAFRGGTELRRARCL